MVVLFCPQQPFGSGEYVDGFVVFFNHLLDAEGKQREFSTVELFGTSQQGVDFMLVRLFGSDVVSYLYQILHKAVFGQQEIYLESPLFIVDYLKILVVTSLKITLRFGIGFTK